MLSRRFTSAECSLVSRSGSRVPRDWTFLPRRARTSSIAPTATFTIAADCDSRSVSSAVGWGRSSRDRIASLMSSCPLLQGSQRPHWQLCSNVSRQYWSVRMTNCRSFIRSRRVGMLVGHAGFVGDSSGNKSTSCGSRSRGTTVAIEGLLYDRRSSALEVESYFCGFGNWWSHPPQRGRRENLASATKFRTRAAVDHRDGLRKARSSSDRARH